MTHLNIQQGLNVEVVTTLIIKKLYEAALSVPEPLEGELDTAYMSGNLLVNKSYRALVEYLTNRFDDLHINVTDSYYIPFEDSAVLNVLLANNIGSDGIGVTEAEAANATITSAMFKNNTNITSFDEFKYFTKANTNPPNLLFMGCSSLSSIDLSNVTTLSNEEFKQTALTNVVLPENITTIPDNWSSLTRSLVSVTAPGVLVINGRAFDLCFGLTSFSDFSNVTTIGQNAFLNAPLTGVFNAPNLTTLGELAFKEHDFEGIECIGTISSIPSSCFGRNYRSSTLLYVYLPYECTELKEGAFARNTRLSVLKQYDKTISAYQEGETKTFLSNLSKITKFGSECFRECWHLPLTGADIVNATKIGNGAFLETPLSGAISLPHLTSIGNNAFLNCTGITSVDLTGSTITSIPYACFSGCSSLTSVTFNNTILSIAQASFNNSSLTSINLPTSLQTLNASAFNNTGIQKLIIPEGCLTIIEGLMKNTSIAYIEIPSSITDMGNFFHNTLIGSSNDSCILVIKATTPPNLNYYTPSMAGSSPQTDSFRTYAFSGIYVPDSSLSVYQSTTGAWSDLKILNKLKPISLLLTDSPTWWAEYQLRP